MKKFCLVFLFVITLTFNLLSAPLIFKSEKEISSSNFEPIAEIDTTKYKSIRVLVKRLGDFEKEDYFNVSVFANEPEQELITSESKIFQRYNQLIDIPPSKLKVAISTTKKSKFIIYIWGI